jgi:hypothetical protein
MPFGPTCLGSPHATMSIAQVEQLANSPPLARLAALGFAGAGQAGLTVSTWPMGPACTTSSPRASFGFPMPTAFHASPKHTPKVVQRADGRYEVHCPQCERMREKPRPIGIGLPITNRAEAEAIVRNHSGKAA